jgi:hypothetical protein
MSKYCKNKFIETKQSCGKGYVFEDRFIDITNLCETSIKEHTIYIFTTPNMKKYRRYIIKKSKNPTKILEYEEVIYFHDCLDEEKMNISKIIIFNKLKRYREHVDKEIFILPEGKDIEYFKDLIKKVIEFVIIKNNSKK